MTELGQQSVSRWIELLKSGENEAAQDLWNRYFERLLGVARRRLGQVPRRAFDEEDVAISVFETLCRGAEEGRFTEMRDRTDLWKLLVTITRQKAVNRIRHEMAAKRGGGTTRGESAFINPNSGDSLSGINEILRETPGPQLLVELDEQHQQLMNRLRDDSLRRVAILRIDGYTNVEIADKLNITTRTVERKLRLVRDTWAEELRS